MLKSYMIVVDSWIGANRCYNNSVNGLHKWIDKTPHLIPYPNLSESICVKVNGNLLKNHNHLLQISVCGLHNDLILPVSQGGFYDARDENGIVCIGDTSPRNYTPNKMNPTRDIDRISFGCETCISVVYLQSNLNKWMSTKLKR